jgi:glycosyltransferase involved in cell wall biosynthesis
MNVGGVAVLLDNLMRSTDTEKFEIGLLTGTCEIPEVDYLEGRVTKYELYRVSTFHKSMHFREDMASFFRIIQIIRKFKPDIIHTHTSKAGLFGRVAGFVFYPRAKRVHTFHGHLLVGYFGRLKLTIVKTVESLLARITDGLIAMGSQVRLDLLDAGIGTSKKLSVLYPGLKMPSFPGKSEARSSLFLDKEKLYVLYIGRLTGIKRPERILDVARFTKNSMHDIHFLIAGDGDLTESLKVTSESEGLPITFLGWRSDIPTLLSASDILLLTSDNEAVALTLIEGAQASLPLITTGAGAVRDIAIDQENAIVTDFNSQHLANAVVLLATEPTKRLEMGRKGRAIAEEKFSISRMVQDHQTYYQEILNL